MTETNPSNYKSDNDGSRRKGFNITLFMINESISFAMDDEHGGSDAATSTISAKVINVTDVSESSLGSYTGIETSLYSAATTIYC